MSIIVNKLWFVNISALSFPVASFFLAQNNLNLNHELNYLDNLHLFQTSFPEFNNHHIWYLSIETPSRQNSLRISWKYLLMAFLLQFYSIAVPPPLLCNICWTSLFNMFWTIQQE